MRDKDLKCIECNHQLDPSCKTVCVTCQFPVEFYQKNDLHLLLLDLTLCKSRVYRYMLLHYYQKQNFLSLMFRLAVLYFFLDLLMLVKERQLGENWKLTNQQFHPPSSPVVYQFLGETLARLVLAFLNEFVTLYLVVQLGYPSKVRRYSYDYTTIMLGQAITYYINISYILFLAWEYNALFKSISTIFQKMHVIQMVRALFEKDKITYPILLVMVQLTLKTGLERLQIQYNPFPFSIIQQ